MKLYSTNNKSNTVSLKQAVMDSLPEDKGLYMPAFIPTLDKSFIDNISQYTFSEIAFITGKALIGDAIPSDELEQITHEAINFPAPLNMLNNDIGTLELFHGPSLAFKDFGARYMSRLMSYFNQDADKPLTILVATSGDTGGAVAAGFHKTPGIEVVILYPSGKVSELQEKQLTTLGDNITACEVEGTFDDCQTMVKKAFHDADFKSRFRMSSANSINIARLIPQTFYYFEGYKQIAGDSRKKVFAVPSGNFGNLTAGLIAKKMGLPVHRFIAATNINKVVPDYLSSGIYSPKPSVSTISNAMDVGNPSNFARILELYEQDIHAIQQDVKGYFYDDQTTKEAMKQVYDKYGYILDPHGAVGYLAVEAYLKTQIDTMGIFLETAHPGKFLQTVEETLDTKLSLPDALNKLYAKQKNAKLISEGYDAFKMFMMNKT